MEEDDDKDKSGNPISLLDVKEVHNATNESFVSHPANLNRPNNNPVSDPNLENSLHSFEQFYEYGDPEDAELSPVAGFERDVGETLEEIVENKKSSFIQIFSPEGSIINDGEDVNGEAMDIDDPQDIDQNVENVDLGFSLKDISLSSQAHGKEPLSVISDEDFDSSSTEDSTSHGQGRRGASRGRYKNRNTRYTYGRTSASGTAVIESGRHAKRGWRALLERMESKDTSGAQNRGHHRGRGRPRGSSYAVRGEQRGRKRGTRAIAEPSREFKKLQSEATQAFIVEGDMEKALVIARKAVQTNPEIYAAHSLLSEVLLTMGRKEDSVGASFSGAHTKRDPKIWWSVADRTLELALGTDERERRQAFLVQAVYCLTMVLKFDNEDYGARMERMRLQLELGNTSKARRDCEKMLEIQPNDAGVLRQLAELCITVEENARAKKLYDEFIEAHIAGTLDDADSFTWSFINIYLDLLDRLAMWQEAIHKLRVLSRYLLKRSEETYWDDFDDDREWDVEDEPRRLGTEKFMPGRYELAAYGLGLPIELRIKLGLFRLRSGIQHYNEALVRMFSFFRFSQMLMKHRDILTSSIRKMQTALWYSTMMIYSGM